MERSLGVPAGWYDDGSGRERWWDSEAWQEFFRDKQQPVVSATPVVPVVPVLAAQPEAVTSAPMSHKAARSTGTLLQGDLYANPARVKKTKKERQQLRPDPPAGSDGNFNARVEGDPYWVNTFFAVAKPSGPALKMVRQHTTDDDAPWLFLTSPVAGALVAFDDRAMIIKTGFMPALGAGSFGGGRSTTFPYRQITGIEYNSGFMTGVLEILTPSYQGSANKDYWRGTGKSPNHVDNNPFAASNTLALNKSEFAVASKHINELRRRATDSHNPAATVASPAPATALSDELAKLAALRDQGVLDEDEFRQAKQGLIAKHS